MENVFSAGAGPGPTLHTVSLTTFIGGQSQTLVQADLISVSPAPAILADHIAHRGELEALHAHPGWPEIWRARKLGEPPAAESIE